MLRVQQRIIRLKNAHAGIEVGGLRSQRRRISIWLWTLIVAVGFGLGAQDLSASDTLVVCPPKFQDALVEWVQYREGQGHHSMVVTPPTTADELKELIKAESQRHPLKHVLLVGDAGPGPDFVPTNYRPGVVNIHFGSDPEIACDHPYVDLDGSGLPDLAIGRLTVDTPEELTSMITRIKNYERQVGAQDWRRRINAIAGVGGFDPVIDRVLEQATRRLIQSHIPDAYPFSMTFGSWSSPFCPAPERFSETAKDKFNEGCLFWVYIGHGHRHGLDRVLTPQGRYEIATNHTVEDFRAASGSPIALLLCCYAGALDDPRDCFAEEMLRQPQGPIAILCGTRVTMPYAMSLLSLEMMQELFHGDAETLGELFRRAKCRMVQPAPASSTYAETRKEIEELGALLSPRPDLIQEELNEHLLLYHLLGDPLLKVIRPYQLNVRSQVVQNRPRELVVTCDVEFDGELTLEVCYPRNRFRERPIFRDESRLTRDANEWMHADYLRHQNLMCTQLVTTVQAGPFRTTVELPEAARGELTVRAFLTSRSGHAIGAEAVVIE